MPPYTPEQFERMKTDANLRRGYFWRAGMVARLLAARARNERDFDKAERLERLSHRVFARIDGFVEIAA